MRGGIFLLIFFLSAVVAEGAWPFRNEADCKFSDIKDNIEEGGRQMNRSSTSDDLYDCVANARSAYGHFKDAEREAGKCVCSNDIKNRLIHEIGGYSNNAAAAINSFRLTACTSYAEISIWDVYDLIKDCEREGYRKGGNSKY
jgi:hypothetical protein